MQWKHRAKAVSYQYLQPTIPKASGPAAGGKRSALNTAKGAAVAAHTPTQMEQDGEVRQPMPAL